MSRRSSSLSVLAGAVLLAVGVLTGCATGAGPAGSASPGETPRGESATPSPAADVDVEAAWLEDGRVIGLILAGSSTCLPMAQEATYDAGVLTVSLMEPSAGTACTRDLVLRGIPVGVPDDVDPTQDLQIEVTGAGYRGETELDGVAGLDPAGAEEFLPSAGWADDDLLALLTYGSSSCRPEVQSATVSGSEIAVTFVTPPADQVCTADMAPRVTVVQLNGDLDDDVSYEAVLSGEGFDATRIPVPGAP
jgi:hypothetical protein